ncbi:MAG TPA: ABC transporter permease [Vicinamibacterales bacterium]|nr:ABC transporter permease [Vicinamibacterales bacterium]
MRLGTVHQVAVHVFKESVRDRVLYSAVLFAGLLMAASFLIGQLSAGQDLKIIKDLGLAAISLFGVFIAIFIGIGLVSKEVDKRSIYALLAKPVTRQELIAGKFAGLALTLAVNIAIMSAVFFVVLTYHHWTAVDAVRRGWEAPAVDPRLLVAVFLIYLQLLIVTALALFFSTFTSPLLAAAFTLGVWVAGHFSADLKAFDEIVEAPAASALGRILYYVLPDFSAFDVKSAVVHGQHVAAGLVGLNVLYAAAVIGVLLIAAALIFSRRDFK